MIGQDIPQTETKSTGKGYILRLAIPADSPPLASLISSVWSEHYAWSVPPEDLERHLGTTLSVENIQKEVEDVESGAFVVAEELASSSSAPAKDTQNGSETLGSSSRIIGVAQLRFNTTESCLTLPKPHVELNRLYALTSFHGTSLARDLVEAADGVARDKVQARCMWLGVWEDNPRGIRFYEKVGFERVGEHVFMVGENRRKDWVMQRAL